MVTGVETTGIILAVLPLVVNQLDNYVQGLETIKVFRTKRYRRELESYLTRLGTAQAIFWNTLEHLLEDVVDSEDEIRDLISNPRGPSWQDAVFLRRLQKRLGRDNDIYFKTMAVLSELLQNLSDKLGLESNPNTGGKKVWVETNTFEREVKKFKDIFSRTIYVELLTKIDNANGVLHTLTQQSIDREEARSKRRKSTRPLALYRRARSHARCLHNAVVQGECWKCPCKDKHLVNLRLEPQSVPEHNHPQARSFRPRFRLALSTIISAGSTKPLWQWQEVDTEAVEYSENNATPARPEHSTNVSDATLSVKKVQFAAVTSVLQTAPWPNISTQSAFPAISDMCSALCGLSSHQTLPAPIGFVSAKLDNCERYNLYLTKILSKDIQTLTLEELLAISWNRSRPRQSHGGLVFNRRDRLFLAMTLACSVLQLHGSWLKPEWRSRDIVFTENVNSNQAVFEQPYISWHISDAEGRPRLKRTLSALIRSEILFPLGLSLVELSLGQTLAEMREPEDNDADEAIADLKTASRLIKDVCYESGGRYGDVVKKCLFWHGPEDADLDNEVLQQAVFEFIVSPLIEDFKDFEGKSHIH